MKTKKLFLLLLILLLSISMVACGDDSGSTDENTNSTLLTEDEYGAFLENPGEFTDRTVENFQVMIDEPIGEELEYHIFRGHVNDENKTGICLRSKENLGLENGDLISVNGNIIGTHTYKSVLGSNVTTPLITINNFEKVEYSIHNPANYTFEVNETKVQHGLTLTIDKVEIADQSTRVYISVKNDSGDKALVYPNMSYIEQGDRQYSTSKISNVETTLKNELNQGENADGCISFEKLESVKEGFTVNITAGTDNANTDFEIYRFNISTK